MTFTTLNIATDGTSQRFALSSAAAADATALDMSEDLALAVANDPDSTTSYPGAANRRVHCTGEIFTIVDLDTDLVLAARRAGRIDEYWASAA